MLNFVKKLLGYFVSAQFGLNEKFIIYQIMKFLFKCKTEVF
jgi:hypothetical protein